MRLGGPSPSAPLSPRTPSPHQPVPVPPQARPPKRENCPKLPPPPKKKGGWILQLFFSPLFFGDFRRWLPESFSPLFWGNLGELSPFWEIGLGGEFVFFPIFRKFPPQRLSGPYLVDFESKLSRVLADFQLILGEISRFWPRFCVQNAGIL